MIRTPAADPLPQRLAALRAELAALIAEFQPAAVAVEHVFFQVNVRTAMSVGQASGLALAEAAAAGCEVAQYTPNQVKDAVAGWGGAAKEQVQKMVQARLRLASPPRPPDAADAAALALCHLASAPMRASVAARDAGGRAVIGSLRGEVLERGLDGTVLIEVGGVGYLVVVSPRTLAELEPTTTVFLYVHHHIREDGQTLYGFATREERATFQVLIGTHGVGPALAMAILATHSPAALVDIVAGGDVGALTLVPGVGRKTAERLLDRAEEPALGAGARPGRRAAAAGRPSATSARRWPGSATARTRSARRCASCRPTPTPSALLRDALKLLGARRA